MKKTWAVLLSCAVLLGLPLRAAAQDATAALVVKLQGSVSVKSGVATQPAAVGTKLQVGDEIGRAHV